MLRMLRMALEGETIEVVEGMFIAVPIGRGEDIQAISTESFGEAVKKAGQKVWEIIAKIAAAIAAAIKGFINHITGRTKNDRGMKDEVRRQYELLAKKFVERKPLTVEDKISSVIKTDGLGTKFWDKLSAEKKAFLAVPGYKDAVVKVTALLSNSGHRSAVIDLINAFVDVINRPVTQDVALEKMRKLFTENVEPMHAAMATAKEALQKVETDKPEFPANIQEQIQVVDGVAGWLSKLNMTTINREWQATLSAAERTLDKVQQRAEELQRKGMDGGSNGLSEVLRRYWEMIKMYLTALQYMRRFEAETWGLAGEIIAFRKDALQRTRSAHKGEADVRAEIDKELDEFFDRDLKDMFKGMKFDFNFDDLFKTKA